VKKVAVIGAKGYVGRAYAAMFAKRFEVAEIDLALPDFPAQQEAARKCDLAVVCVPTPQKPDGSCDTSAVETTVRWLTDHDHSPLIVIKSTIPPGTTARLAKETGKRVVFSPEYIGEGGYTVPWWKGHPHPTDPSLHNFCILGGFRGDVRQAAQFFKPILGPEARFFFTDSTTAELCKYMENSFFALKVSFCNEFYELARAFGVDYDELREAWLLDERNTRSHTHVFPDRRGFDGKCLPKDLSAIIEAGDRAGYPPEILRAVQDFNNRLHANL
jgi:UDPglucose 6-dehydrogenase